MVFISSAPFRSGTTYLLSQFRGDGGASLELLFCLGQSFRLLFPADEMGEVNLILFAHHFKAAHTAFAYFVQKKGAVKNGVIRDHRLTVAG